MPRLDSVAPSELKLDLINPRIPDAQFDDENEVLEYLYKQADLGELIQSIGNSGWLDFEPLIVEEHTNVVIEGNRRLATLRVLADANIQRRLRVTLPEPLHDNATPERIQANFVESRKQARDFIGFKHVNGAFKWDSYAKARFAYAWLKDGDDIEEVSRRLGDGHNTISRLVNGVVVLEQAEKEHLFDKEEPTKRSFYFSHLYTALSTPNVRAFLGIADADNAVLSADPVPEDHRASLRNLLSWLYGQGDEPSVIRSQNPDLGRLVQVLGNRRATDVLVETRDLSRAFDLVDDRARAFEKAFYRLLAASEDVSAVIGRYDPSSELLNDAQDLQRTVDSIVQAMTRAHANTSDGNAS